MKIEPKEIKTEEYFDNKIVVLFALPGAFTPDGNISSTLIVIVHS